MTAAAERAKAVREAVSDSWDFWLNEREISLPRLIGHTVYDAVEHWLNHNGDMVSKAISDGVTAWMNKNATPPDATAGRDPEAGR